MSVRTVEKHGRLENWKERLARVRAEAAEAADARIAEVRAEKLAELELLIDASWTTYAHQLRAGSVRVAPVDLVRLFKLREDLWAQAAAESTARRTAAAAETDSDEDREARKHEIVRALHEAGAFDRLQTLLTPTPEPNDDTAPATEAA